MKSHKVTFFLCFTLFPLFFAVGCATTPGIKIDLQFANRCLEEGLWKEAVFRYKRIIEKDPRDPVPHNNLGIAYEALGEIEKARQEYEAALRLDPKNELIKANLKGIASLHKKSQENENNGSKKSP